MGRIFFCWVVVIMVVLMACGTAGKTGSRTSGKKEQIVSLNTGANEEDGKIVFLTFKVAWQDSLNERYRFSLLDRKLIDGTLKRPSFRDLSNVDLEPYYFYCELLDDKLQVVDMIKIEDPLKTAYEYIGEDDGFAKAVVRKSEGDFTIRFNASKKLSRLRIWHLSEFSDQKKQLYEANF